MICNIEDWEGYCEECGMVGEHDRRCPTLAELRQERADHLLDCKRDEEMLRADPHPPRLSRKPS